MTKKPPPGYPLRERIRKARRLDGGAPMVVGIMEAAARLRVGRSTMQRLVAEKKVRSVKIGNRSLRVFVSSLDEYLKALERHARSRPR